MDDLKGRVNISFIREFDVPQLGESNLIGPKKSVEVKFFMVAFFGVHPMDKLLLYISKSHYYAWKYARYD